VEAHEPQQLRMALRLAKGSHSLSEAADNQHTPEASHEGMQTTKRQCAPMTKYQAQEPLHTPTVCCICEEEDWE
jgi:hypothetical protein